MVSNPYVLLAYLLGVTLCVLPLAHILLRRRFQTYAVYFVFMTGFLTFNMAGALSPNILTRVYTPVFYMLLLVVAFVMAALYPILIAMGSAVTHRGGLRPLAPPSPEEETGYARLVWLLLLAGIGGALVTFAGVARPLILRFDLFGNMVELMQMRTEIVMNTPIFTWLSILFFEFPAVAVIIAAILRGVALKEGNQAAARRWGRFLMVGVPIAAVISVSYFHVSVLVNLLAALALAALFVQGRIPARLIARYAVPASLGIVLMYMGKQGFRLTAESLSQLGGLLVHRLFEVYSWGGAIVMYIFPREHSFLHGTSFINFFGLFDYEQINLSTFVYPYIYSDDRGSSPVPAVIEGYANFGWAGALGILAIVVALIIAITLLSWSDRPFHQGIALYLTIKGITVWQVALWFGLMDLTLLFLLPWLWLAYRLFVPRPGRTLAPLYPVPLAEG
jgi:hypothetical protein